MKYFVFLGPLALILLSGCAHKAADPVSSSDAARIDRKLVRDAVVFEPGTEDGATIPEVSSPRIRAILVPEHIDDNGTRLVESHREWLLDGSVVLLGTPSASKKQSTAKGSGK